MSGPPDSPVPATALRPASLIWLYGLIVALVASVGAAAGSIFFDSHWPLALSYGRAVTACERALGIAVGGGSAGPVDLGFLRCVADTQRGRAWVMTAGAAAVLLGFAAVVAVVPRWDRWRVRRYAGRLLAPAAYDRFAALCAARGLTGRRGPVLVVAPPPVRQPFTTGTVRGRPVVVLPLAVALDRSRRFDAVVHHELAHVAARDVAWVAVARGLAWVLVPALLAANAPTLWTPGADLLILGESTGRAAVLALLAACLAAALLRMRERHADRVAAAWAGAAPLVAALGADRTSPVGRWGRLTSVLARHPRPAQRVASLRRAEATSDGTAGQAGAVGLVAGLSMVLGHQLAQQFDATGEMWVAPGVVGGVLLGLGLTPGFARHARSARRGGAAARWWRPVLAAAAGAAGGRLLAPTAVVGLPVPPSSDYGLVATVVGAVAVAAAAATCVVVARLVAARGTRSGPRWRAAMYAAAAAVAVALLWPVPPVVVSLNGGSSLRGWWVYALPAAPWPYLAAALPVAAVLAVRVRAFRWQAAVWTPAAVTAVGAAAALLYLWTHPPRTLDGTLRSLQVVQSVALTVGGVIVAAGLRRRSAATSPSAVLGGALAVLGTGLAALAYWAAAGFAVGPVTVRTFVGAPLVWFGYLAAAVTALAVLAEDATPRRTAQPGAGPAPVGAVRAWLRAPAAPIGAAALACAAVTVLGVPGGYTAPVTAPTVRSGPPTRPDPTALASPTPATAGRPLGPAEVAQVAALTADVLPRYWQPHATRTRPGPPSRATPALPEPPSRAGRCAAFAEDRALHAWDPSQRATATASYETRPATMNVSRSLLFVTVSTYAHPVAPSLFTAAEADRAACPSYELSGIRFTPRPAAAPTLGDQAWRADVATLINGPRPISGTMTHLMVRRGHHLVKITFTAIMEPVDETLLHQATARVVAALPAARPIRSQR
ncbi:hypothetical protein GCM10010124_13960 [Pilimelia terevasa]|uniref:Peptidase M48 domain-containing protein n=1 Tax=Pilimelia terevasa TaxID=53372 RepID=A0A8J3FFX4_9ACTN|nr:M48 family metalloprotease [Pilimelia terevasa]GGK22643.1 hypothetical protein GCM10010124_13960 [Pilimelia terevasa]